MKSGLISDRNSGRCPSKKLKRPKNTVWRRPGHSVTFYAACNFMVLFCCPNGYFHVENTTSQIRIRTVFIKLWKWAHSALGQYSRYTKPSGVFPPGCGSGMFPENWENSSWRTTQRTHLRSFMVIDDYLGMEKSEQKWSGESGEGGNNTF